MFQFITKRPLWINILFALGLAILLLMAFLGSLDWLTHHGKVLRIPMVAGKSMEEARQLLEKEGFDVVIQDSLYVDTLAPLRVIKQFPDADEMVKVNRTVYLTINRAVPPLVDMPNLVGLSFRSAQIVLKQYGLKLGDTSFKPDFAKNSVLNQLYEGRDIKPGEKINMASPISLVLGSGISDADMSVPDLVGMTYGEAKVFMEANGLNFGVVSPDPNSADNLFIYWQSPSRLGEDNRVNRIHQGQMIDIKLQAEKPLKSDSLNPTPPAPPNNY